MNRRKLYLLMLIAFVLSLALIACQEGPHASADFYNLRKLNLRLVDKSHMLAMARAALEDKAFSKEEERYGLIYNKEPRGVFLTLRRPNEAALTAFGFGDSIYDAIQDAGAKLRILASKEDIANLKLRIDLMDESTDTKEQSMKKRWKIDLSMEGLIFETKPVAAFMPFELRDWAIFSKKSDYNFGAMKRLIKHRNMGKVLYDQLDGDESVRYARFSVISFMEGDGADPVLLYRGNRLEGFEPTEENLYKAINAAGNYLKQAVKEDGSFEYLYFPQTSKISRDYNELRHAGTVFSMGQIYEINKDPELLAAIQRGLGWLERNSMGPDTEDSKKYDWLAVTHQKHLYAKLGGCGLALLAFGEYTEVTGDTKYLDLMRAYGRFIEYMQEDNGDMRMRYWHRPQDKNREVTPVLYYPGEAFFGLSKLYHLDNNNPRWQKVAEKGLDFIADVRDIAKTTKTVDHDHWLMYAIDQWYRVKPKENQLRHAWKVVDAMMAKFNWKSKSPDLVGGYLNRPQSTPSACRLEGTAAMYELSRYLKNKEQEDRLYPALELGASFLMRNQYNDINTMFFQNPEKAMGGYMGSYWSPEIQIDYVQHSTSALIGAYKAIMEKKKASEEQPQEKPAEAA